MAANMGAPFGTVVVQNGGVIIGVLASIWVNKREKSRQSGTQNALR
jgi:hypothetical protein